MEISGGGGGGSKAKTFEGKYEATLEFPEGVVSLRKSLLWGVEGYGYFLKLHIVQMGLSSHIHSHLLQCQIRSSFHVC